MWFKSINEILVASKKRMHARRSFKKRNSKNCPLEKTKNNKNLKFACARAEPETRQFLESNPSIVLLENVKNVHKEEILERLKSSLLGL